MSRDIRDAPDPLAEALSITTVHLAEDLDTDHDGGRNYTRSVGLHRRRDGRLTLLVDTELPGVPRQERDPDLEWRAD